MVDISQFTGLLDLSPRAVSEKLLMMFYGSSKFSRNNDIFEWQIRAVEWHLISLINMYVAIDENQILNLSKVCRTQEQNGFLPPFGFLKALVEKLISLHCKYDDQFKRGEK